MKFFLPLIAIIFLGCQTPSQKAQVELEKAMIRFRGLESRTFKTCVVRSELSAPTQAKYAASFPNEKVEAEKNYLWHISGNACALEPLLKDETQWARNHTLIMRWSFCTFVMGFQIESPLAGVEWEKLKRTYADGAWRWEKPREGFEKAELRLEPLQLELVASNGAHFKSSYQSGGSFLKLASVERETKELGLKIGDIEFQDFSGGPISTLFPREISRLRIHTRDANFNEYQLYGEAKVLRCE